MHYIIYKTTNKINGKIYVGCHRTDSLNDGYLGSGKILKRAIVKYGIANFKREILQTFDNSADMFDMEVQLVNEDFVNRDDTYNLMIGGYGGWTQINEKLTPEERSWHRKNFTKKHIFTEEERRAVKSEAGKQMVIAKKGLFHPNTKTGFGGMRHHEESKRKIGIANSISQKGNKNSQYGSCWIYSPDENINKKIKLAEVDQYISNGWIRGRKLK